LFVLRILHLTDFDRILIVEDGDHELPLDFRVALGFDHVRKQFFVG